MERLKGVEGEKGCAVSEFGRYGLGDWEYQMNEGEEDIAHVDRGRARMRVEREHSGRASGVNAAMEKHKGQAYRVVYGMI